MLTRLPDGFVPKTDLIPVVARDASTVAILRDTPGGRTQTYLLRRQPTMAFAAGMSVFPGGSIQAGDEEALEGRWIGPSADEWAARLRCTPETAVGLVVAAIRETFEESGVLLAGPDARTTATELDGPEFVQVRLDLDRGERSLASVLREHEWVLRTDLLGFWAHWITPEQEPRRFDTRFFVAALPEGQRVGSLPGEADLAAWVEPQAAIDAALNGGHAMMPPTISVCRDLVGVKATDVVALSQARTIQTILPKFVQIDGAWYVDNGIEDPR